MLRIGTLALMGMTHLDVSLNIGATGSHVPYKSLIWVHAAFKPDAVRAGCQAPPKLRPGTTTRSGFDIDDSISARHQRFAFARLPRSYLTGSRPAFSATLTTTALNGSSLQWFGASACSPTPRDLPSSLAQFHTSFEVDVFVAHDGRGICR